MTKAYIAWYPPMKLKQESRLRKSIAQHAAKLIATEGINDYYKAKIKAATQLGISDKRHLPKNSEIETALMNYQILFHQHSHASHLNFLREQALRSMEFFARFSPRLTGAVLTGSAGKNSEINLHLFTDAAELVGIFLLDHKIPFRSKDKNIRLEKDIYEMFPAFEFIANDIHICLTVFPLNQLKSSPVDPIDGKPMRRANISQVRSLLG